MPQVSQAERERYAEDIALGWSRFFEPRRLDCPWCGSTELKRRLRTTDIMQRKPGVFYLDRCTTCQHIFQNPRLNIEGLEFYYRDFYDGFGREFIDSVFSTQGWLYEPRAKVVEDFFGPEGPKNWLDVGTGYGHFANDARKFWPNTTFDGLDMGSSLIEGKARGWLDNIYPGEFADHAEELTGRYDVISMHHYLEHVRDPRADLDLVAKVLPTGGFVSIEVPDGSSWLGKAFGRWWAPWYQPQHQHLVPLPNLLAALRERNLTPVRVQHKEAHITGELSCALIFFLTHISPNPDSPWLPEPTQAQRKLHAAIWKVAPKMLAQTFKVDFNYLGPFVLRHGGSNAIRVLARKDG
ncbi:MAG: class I SAM-dependent methyltransferase [Sporichthyaceae bacterium]